MINNGRVTAPVTMTDIGVITGQSTRNLKELIITAAYGGSNNGLYNQAFWTKEHCLQGTNAIGWRIKGCEPHFNIFSEDSPVEWFDIQGELNCILKNTGKATSQKYSFSLGDFRNYNHNAMKCMLHTPPDFISSSTSRNLMIEYDIPQWFKEKLPQLFNNSFYVLSMNPPEYNENVPFYSTVRIIDYRDSFRFEVQLRGLPQYKDESTTLQWYVSVWDWIGDPLYPGTLPDNDPAHYTFRYSMPDIGSSYYSATKVTGSNERPPETVNMEITMESRGSFDYGYYTRISPYMIEVRIINLELHEPSMLYCDENGFELGPIDAIYHEQFVQVYSFPAGNATHFTIKPNY